MKILHAITGSVAAKLFNKESNYNKLTNIKSNNVEWITVISNSVEQFLSKDTIKKAFTDDSEAVRYRSFNSVLHIDLRDWADVLLIAPLTANTLSKMSIGMCDNLITNIVRAWDRRKPIILAPAMNTQMYTSPFTEKALRTLKEVYPRLRWLEPQNKTLVCGETGIGAMCDIDLITEELNNVILESKWDAPLHIDDIFIPQKPHPGGFGAVRKHDIHTGVDIYTTHNRSVYAMEEGDVVKIAQFTGPEVGSPWWNTTYAMMVKGPSGIINYGEIAPYYAVGDKVKKGQYIGAVKAVLPPEKIRKDIPHHSNAMLHIELYKSDHYSLEFAQWDLGQEQPHCLLDPTEKLQNSIN